MSAQSRAVIYVLVVFLSGAVAGALCMHLAEHYYLHPQRVNAAVNDAENWNAERTGAIELFRQQLHLSDDQARQLEGILDETMRQYEDLHSFTHHIRDDGLMRIRAMLDDSQKKQFDELTRRIETPDQRKQRRLREQQEAQQQSPATAK